MSGNKSVSLVTATFLYSMYLSWNWNIFFSFFELLALMKMETEKKSSLHPWPNISDDFRFIHRPPFFSSSSLPLIFYPKIVAFFLTFPFTSQPESIPSFYLISFLLSFSLTVRSIGEEKKSDSFLSFALESVEIAEIEIELIWTWWTWWKQKAKEKREWKNRKSSENDIINYLALWSEMRTRKKRFRMKMKGRRRGIPDQNIMSWSSSTCVTCARWFRLNPRSLSLLSQLLTLER